MKRAIVVAKIIGRSVDYAIRFSGRVFAGIFEIEMGGVRLSAVVDGVISGNAEIVAVVIGNYLVGERNGTPRAVAVGKIIVYIADGGIIGIAVFDPVRRGSRKSESSVIVAEVIFRAVYDGGNSNGRAV